MYLDNINQLKFCSSIALVLMGLELDLRVVVETFKVTFDTHTTYFMYDNAILSRRDQWARP